MYQIKNTGDMMRSPPPSWDQPSKIAILKKKKTKTGTFHGDAMEIFIMGISLAIIDHKL